MERIQLAHGSGGLENQQLIRTLFVEKFGNAILDEQDDAAVLEVGKIAVSTDAFTVKPLFFPGGDIGRLAVAGTANDVAMRGAEPLYLTVSFIIEEGFELPRLREIVASMADELEQGGLQVVTGDTKVVPRGAIDGVMVTTTGIGRVLRDCSVKRIRPGDRLLVSGPVAEHGACIFAAREEISVTGLVSDCRNLWPAVRPLLEQDLPVHAMRDATRGGLSAVLNEWAGQSGCELLIEEQRIPVSEQVAGFTELLGLDPYVLACEGVFLLAVAEEGSRRVLELLHAAGQPQATLIGRVGARAATPRVVLTSAYGTERLMEYPSGEILPRIC